MELAVNQIITDLVNSLNMMEDQGKVDLSVVKTLDNFIASFKEVQERWLQETTVRPRDAFYYYYAARNSELVLSKMKERIISSESAGDNPKVVQDSLLLAPIIGDLYEQLTAIKRPDALAKRIIVGRVRQLRATASETNLLPSEEEELKGSDLKEMTRRVEIVVAQFGDSSNAL